MFVHIYRHALLSHWAGKTFTSTAWHWKDWLFGWCRGTGGLEIREWEQEVARSRLWSWHQVTEKQWGLEMKSQIQCQSLNLGRIRRQVAGRCDWEWYTVKQLDVLSTIRGFFKRVWKRKILEYERECKRMPVLLSILLMICQMEIHWINGVIGGINDLS